MRNLLKTAEIYSRRTRADKDNEITKFYEELKGIVRNRFNLDSLTEDEDMFLYLVAYEATKDLNRAFKYTPNKVVNEFVEFMDMGYFEKVHYCFYDISIDNEQNLFNPLYPNKEYEDLRLYDETYGYFPLAIEVWGNGNIEANKKGQKQKSIGDFVEFVLDVIEYGDTNFTEDEKARLLNVHGYDPKKASADLQMYHNVQARKRTLAKKQEELKKEQNSDIALSKNPAMLSSWEVKHVYASA